MQEIAPLLGEQRAIGLDTIVNDMVSRIFTLQADCMTIERERTQHRLTAMPREQHLALRLHGDVLPGELLEEFITHLMMLHILIEL